MSSENAFTFGINTSPKQPAYTKEHQKLIDMEQERAIKEIETSTGTLSKLNESMIYQIISKTLANLYSNHIYLIKGTDLLYSDRDLDFGGGIIIEKGQVYDTQLKSAFLYWLQMNSGFDNVKSVDVNRVIDAFFYNPRRSVNLFEMRIKNYIAKGQVKPNIYHRIMVKWLKAPDNEYSIFWLKSLVYNMIFQQLEPEGNFFQRAPYRYYIISNQGTGKSTLFQRLALGSSFEYMENEQAKDIKYKMSNNALMIMDDKGFSGSTKEVDLIKSLVTTPYDEIRRPFAKHSERVFLRSLIVGSTNRRYLYTDTTGERREMPLSIGVGRTREQSLRDGREFFKRFTTDVICDLFATIWDEFEGNFKSPLIIENYPEIEKLRKAEIMNHQRTAPTESAVTEVLSHKVPADYVSKTKDEQIKLLEMEPVGKMPFGEENGELISLNELDKFPLKPVNDRIRVLSYEIDPNRKPAYNEIISLMNDRGGYSVKRQSDGLYYKHEV